MRTIMRSTIITGAIAFLLLMTTDVLVAMVTHDYWGIACLPAGGVIGWGIARVVYKKPGR